MQLMRRISNYELMLTTGYRFKKIENQKDNDMMKWCLFSKSGVQLGEWEKPTGVINDVYVALESLSIEVFDD